ncbi:DUF3307 domain-containing protein [Spirosoma luteolum]
MLRYFTADDTALLIRLLLSHLMADFFFQPTAWVFQKRTLRHRSRALYWHSILAGLLAYLLAGIWDGYWVFGIVVVTHCLIDWLKATYGSTHPLRYFLFDQLSHLVVLVLVWMYGTKTWTLVGRMIVLVFTDPNTMAVLTGYLICTTPLSFVVGIATKRWQQELDSVPGTTYSLADAGRWIGISERVIIFSLVLVGQYEAIGFLIAAKSLLRFKETEATKQSEYVLIGTLLSYGLAILLGLATAGFIGN